MSRSPALLAPWVAGVAVVITAVPAPGADVYRWVDERGHVHYAAGIDSVPERFRPRATRLQYQSAPPAGAPAAGPASSQTVIAFQPGQRIYVTARVNGRASARLMLDTGADRTVIAPRALSAAGISLRASGVSGRIQGATGTADVQAYEVESVEVGNARVGKLLVVSHDINDGDSDGLLGRDFLDHFTVTIDNAAGQVTLAPK
jgi:predicted aspartyl protease